MRSRSGRTLGSPLSFVRLPSTGRVPDDPILGSRWPSPDQIATTERLHAAGIDDRVLTASVSLGSIVRLRRGAYIRAADWFGVKPWEQDKLRLQAHFLGTRSAGVYSHVSAARLHDCWVWRAGPAVHVTVPSTTSRSNHGPDLAPHHLPLGAADVVQLKTRAANRFV
jgi:hypothetical protein